ncbi:MAG: TRAP transporter small permease [Mesorhizobium sp.]|jgi:TRAP-type C4-dicarboxylate transport system permease small subunit
MNLPQFVERLAQTLAIIGGIVLGVIITLTVVSVAGRAFVWAGLGPIPGDFELVEALTGFAVFCFLPYCQLKRGHAIIDVLTKAMGPRLVRLIDALAEILMAFALALIAWRLTLGALDKFGNHETTFIREMPVWVLYGICVLPAWIAVLTALFTSGMAIKSVVIGRDILPEHQGFE